MTDAQNNDLLQRVVRMESRLVQLMYHMGLDPTLDKLNRPRATHLVWRQREKEVTK